jgi:signal peptidase
MVNLVFVCLLLGMAFTMVAPLWTDWGFRAVVSGSMEPAIPIGSLVVVEPTDPTSIRYGDVVTFESPEERGMVVTHRVIEVNGPADGRLFRTQGDANDDVDLVQVPAENVLGQVRFHLPYLGYLAQYIRTRQGWLYLVLIPGAALVVIELARILKVIWSSDDTHSAGLDAGEGSAGCSQPTAPQGGHGGPRRGPIPRR